MALFHESTNPARLFFLALILIGIIGLKFFGGSHAEPAKNSKAGALQELDAEQAP
jgi:hypothetical protein